MKISNNKYLHAICHVFDLVDGSSDVPPEQIAKAIQWAVGSKNIAKPYHAVALQPVLETVGKARKTNRWFPAVELTLAKEAFFPKGTKPDQGSLQNRLDALKAALKASKEHNWLNCLHYHASTLAVSDELPDIPLFDFIKTSSAILHCLESGNGKLRLAGGSISGIQSYLYDIVSKRAGKLLKGRSFYLQLLSDSLAERFLEWFELSDAHIVYSSGGGFYVLMPDCDGIFDRFEDFKSEVIRQIYKRHGINLICEFAISAPFDENVDTPKIWDELLQCLNETKTQRLSHNSALLEDLLGIVDEGGADNDENSKFTRDTVTNDQILRSESETFDEDGNLVHRFTNAQQYLGRDLRDANFWISSKNRFSEKCFADPLGYFHLLENETPKDLPSNAMIQSLNQPSATTHFIFYGGNKIPINLKTETIDGETFYKGDPKTFDQLAEGKRLHRLGILRMDVDNLGKIFSADIGTPASFARYASVSRSLDWFFKGYLNTIYAEECKTSKQRFSERTIIIYSGGDDLFIVGRWLEVIEMACRIREDFKEWSGNNLTISGGVAILSDNFPVMQGANRAGEQEKIAKSYLLGTQKLKNAICIFDQALNWENELPVVVEWKNKLREWLDVEKLDISILKKIDQHAESWKEWKKEKEKDPKYQIKEKLNPRWVWNMIYDMGRFANKVKNKDVASEIRIMASDATFGDFDFKQGRRAVPFLYLLQTAARWVELEQRTLKNNDSNS